MPPFLSMRKTYYRFFNIEMKKAKKCTDKCQLRLTNDKNLLCYNSIGEIQKGAEISSTSVATFVAVNDTFFITFVAS